MVLELDAFCAALDGPRGQRVPADLRVLLPGLLWTSMVLTAVRDEGLARGGTVQLVNTLTIGADRTLLADVLRLSQVGVVYAGGMQFLGPCVNARVFALFAKVRPYLERFFATGDVLAAPPAAPYGRVTGGSAPSAMRSALAARSRAPRAWSAAPRAARAERLPDPALLADARRAAPTPALRRALAAYRSPLEVLPAVARLTEDGAIVAAVGGGAKKKRAARGGARGAGAGDAGAAGGGFARLRAALAEVAADDARGERLMRALEGVRAFAPHPQ